MDFYRGVFNQFDCITKCNTGVRISSGIQDKSIFFGLLNPVNQLPLGVCLSTCKVNVKFIGKPPQSIIDVFETHGVVVVFVTTSQAI